tara:strand:+ start:589 stop:783 length:195 start_codon:yes stop_codon:yes gene_type:complete
LNKIPLAKKEEERPDNSLNVKEVGFMLRLIDEGVHQGKFLELALQVKLKLQNKMEQLMNHKEVI